MIDKQQYQRTFSVLHASGDFLKEELTMKPNKHISLRRITVLCAAAVVLFSLATVCYAADVGGIRRTIQLWIHGDQTNAVLDIQNGDYTLTFNDADGKTQQIGGGGVHFNPDGSERPLTEEDILEHLNSPELEYREDGTVWLYYYDQVMEITDRFNEDGVLFLQIENGSETLYLTIKEHGGMAISPDAYIQPEEFN